jgi:putative phosphoesterase
MRLLLLADTHVPARARDLPAAVWAAVDEADLVIHAGDWVDVALLDRLLARATALLGVWGNNDGAPLRARLPEVARATVEGVRVAVVHETGSRTGREQRADAAYPDTDVLVFGHSHIPWDSVTPGGLRLLNPGSPTDRRAQPACTYLTATARSGHLEDVTLHSLPRMLEGEFRGDAS